MIQGKDICKKFGDFQALDRASFHVPKGAVYGLVGPNGAGKSTILRHVTGIFRQDSGELLIDGEPVFENPEAKRKLTFIPDDVFYFRQANLKEMKKYYEGIYPTFDAALFDKLMDCFPAVDRKRNIRRMSKGMQKQAAFWLTVCCMPEYLILDEPVDGLDPVMRRQVWSLLLGDVAERGTTVLVSSHNLRELEDVCDHVGILDHGRVLLERSLSDLQDNTVKLQVAYPGVTEPVLPAEMQILHRSHVGRVYTYIVRGSREDILRRMQITEPVLLESIPLTLEEIFIYELGGVDYAAKDILL